MLSNKFFHDGSMGDIVYSLPAVKAMGGGDYYVSRREHFDFMRGLMVSQACIHSFHLGMPEGGFIDLRKYRGIALKAISDGEAKHLADSHAEACGIQINRSGQWIYNIEQHAEADIIINRTNRYHGASDFDYGIFTNYKDRTLFLGLPEEHSLFCELYGFEPEYRRCINALEAARIIKGSKLFAGNQSLCFALAEGMKHPRVLEICQKKDNCRPSGRNWFASIDPKIIGKCLE